MAQTENRSLSFVVSPIRCDLLPAHGSPYPPAPLPDGKGVLALSPEPLPQKGFLWFSAEVLLHEGAFERLEQRRAPLDAFLLTIDFVNEVREFGLERERGQFDFKPLQSCY